ncbi:hypothetical protein ACFVWT_11150 [Arthrobacter sp. NPDC058288]|uniref:hypothetical protein n=1 Tax=Arthrobacter sp. NPDC058288 TaxID=3346424 RepID=UPI0036F0F62E
MKVLLDANIVIAIEGDTNRQHVNAEAAATLHRLILAADGAPCIIENVRDDFVRTTNTQLRTRRLREISKYLALARLSIRPDFAERARYSWPLSPNDKVDAAHLLAVERNAVTWLVTEDRGIHRRAQYLGLADRVMSIADAIASLKALLFEPIEHYAVESVSPHQFDLSDPIFDSLRVGYPSFDAWWQNKVVAENRHCLVLGSIEHVTGFAVLKADSPDVGTLPGRALKICTFKISDSAVGAKRGELLLGTVIEHARSNSYDSCFVEVQEHHGPLIALLQEFGFYRLGEKSPGEHVFGKVLTPHLDHEHYADPLEYNRRYGPGAMLVERAYLVPVIPAWHGMLFPSTSPQPSLFDQTYGNAVRKVYLCHSNIKKLNPGDALFFLRTRSEQAVHAVGVLEATLRTTEADQILGFAGTRTVFSRDEIEKMCDRPVLAIRFRLNAILERPVSVEELRELGVVKRSPQSIAELRSERGKSWARNVVEE